MSVIHSILSLVPSEKKDEVLILIEQLGQDYSLHMAQYYAQHSPEIKAAEMVAKRMYGVTPEQLRSKSHDHEVAKVRGFIWLWIKENHPKTSLATMGMMYNRHHSTVIHTFKEIAKKRAEDKRFSVNLEMFLIDVSEAVAELKK